MIFPGQPDCEGFLGGSMNARVCGEIDHQTCGSVVGINWIPISLLFVNGCGPKQRHGTITERRGGVLRRCVGDGNAPAGQRVVGDLRHEIPEEGHGQKGMSPRWGVIRPDPPLQRRLGMG